MTREQRESFIDKIVTEEIDKYPEQRLSFKSDMRLASFFVDAVLSRADVRILMDFNAISSDDVDSLVMRSLLMS